MSSIIPRVQFASDCGIQNNNLTILAKRGKLVINSSRCDKCDGKVKPCKSCAEKEFIDLSFRNPDGFYINMDFYKRYAEKIDIPKPEKTKSETEKVVKQPVFISKPVIIGPKKEEESEDFLADLSESSSDVRLTRAKKFRDIQNREVDTRLKELQEAKLRGEMIPTSLVKEMFKIFQESVKRAYLDAGEGVITFISERLQAAEHDKAIMRTKLNSSLNTAVNNSVNAAQSEMENILRAE